MTRLDEMIERWQERPGVFDEVIRAGQEWEAGLGEDDDAALPPYLGLAIATASDLQSALYDLAALLVFARKVEMLAGDLTGILSTRELKTILAELENR